MKWKIIKCKGCNREVIRGVGYKYTGYCAKCRHTQKNGGRDSEKNKENNNLK